MRTCRAFDTWPQNGRKGTFLTALELIQICRQGGLTHMRIGGVVVRVKRLVLPTCVGPARLTSGVCLGGTPFGRSQVSIRSTARPVMQRSMRTAHPAGRGARGSYRAVVAFCPAIGGCALVCLGGALQVTPAPLL